MLKRVLALLCLIVMFVGVFTAASTRANAAGTDFQVGYARVDINPYVVDGDINSGIMELPLIGSGDVWNRLSTAGLIDDNGDGKVNKEDGLSATCIAVTDYNGNTILLITIDLIGGLMDAKVRAAICSRVDAALTSGELTNVKLDASQIYYAGTHTHNAPDATVYSASGKTGTNSAGKDLSVVNRNLGIWIDRTVQDVADAAIVALKDRAAAKITKNAIRASEDTKSPVKGKVMVSTRHYVNEIDGCVAGDNFNTIGTNPKQVTEANDTMYLLQFDFSEHNSATGANKLPIVLANWRGHPSLNNSDSYYSSKNAISSDYINAFRFALENGAYVLDSGKRYIFSSSQKYRVAFFLGASGNINPRGYEKNGTGYDYSWIDNYSTKNKDCRGNGYGNILCALAQHGLEKTATQETVAGGSIRTMQQRYNMTRRDTGISALAYEAAVAYQKEGQTGRYVYTSPTTGEVFVIGSVFHASNIRSYWNETLEMPRDDLVSMELNAFMLGEDLAFVTASGELFDYYYKEDEIFTPENNLWNDLADSTYGTPFVLSCCNNLDGYVPNSYAYDYNLGSDTWSRGSYEANYTPYPKGTGEALMGVYGKMLDAVSTQERRAECAHCKETVTWKPYDGTTDLPTGHYYLVNDNSAAQIPINAGQTVCLDLNGHTFTGEPRAFYTLTDGGATLSIMDSSPEKTGVVQGCGMVNGAAIGFGGATILIDRGNELNLYSGTLTQYQKGFCGINSGGVIRSMGTVNMYGGTIRDGIANSFQGSYLYGGAITTGTRSGTGATVHSVGEFNMYGGKISGGTVNMITGSVTKNASGANVYSETAEQIQSDGACFYAGGYLKVGGDAQIENVYFPRANSGSYLTIDTSSEPFTGKLHLSYAYPVSNGMSVGTCTVGTVLADDAITYKDIDLKTVVTGNKITAIAPLMLRMKDGSLRYYSTLTDAAKAYPTANATSICLLTDLDEDARIENDVCLDLNGYDLTGEVTVADGAVLRGMDSETDDFTVSNGRGYGKVSNVYCEGTGSVEGLSQDWNQYLKVTESDGVSFHKVSLKLTHMALRPSCAGVYYSCNVASDEVAAEQVRSFGISLGLSEAGTSVLCDYSGFSQFSAGADGNTGTGTLLKDIMKTSNSSEINARNAAMQIYGRAYIETEEGYFFGPVVQRSLQEQMVEIDRIFSTLGVRQRLAVVSMYRSYSSVMSSWDIPAIKKAYGA